MAKFVLIFCCIFTYMLMATSVLANPCSSSQKVSFNPVSDYKKKLGSFDKDDRVKAILTACYTEDTGVIPEIMELLKDSSWKVRSTAISALGKLKAKQALPELSELSKDNDKRVRALVMKALGNIDDQRVLSILARGIGDPDWHSRISAEASLIKIRSPDTAQYLLSYLKDASHEFQLRSAWKVVHAINSDKVVKLLVDNLENERLRSVTPGDGTPKRYYYSEYIRNTIKFLSRHKSAELENKLIQLLAHRKSDLDASAVLAVIVLGKFKSNKALKLLKQASNSNVLYFKNKAIISLGEIGGKGVAPLLLAHLKDLKGHEWKQAIIALGKTKDKVVTEFLIKEIRMRLKYTTLFKDKVDIFFRKVSSKEEKINTRLKNLELVKLIEALGRGRDPKAHPLFMNILQGYEKLYSQLIKKRRKKNRMKSGLSDLHVSNLSPVYHHPQMHDVRPVLYQTIIALGKLKDKRSLDILMRIARRSDWLLQKASFIALGEVQDHKVIPLLTMSINNQSSGKQAILALSKFKQKQVLPILIEAYHSSRGYNKKQRLWALLKYNGLEQVEAYANLAIEEQNDPLYRDPLAKFVCNSKSGKHIDYMGKKIGKSDICEIGVLQWSLHLQPHPNNVSETISCWKNIKRPDICDPNWKWVKKW